jgi:DNA-binding transcriptional regulator YdaS (Cro superfamily)
MMKVEANRKVLALAGGSHMEVARILGYDDRRNVWPWTNGLRPFPPHHAHALERRFPGQITRQELRPHDWQKHWPDLIVPAGAPAVSETAPAAIAAGSA